MSWVLGLFSIAMLVPEGNNYGDLQLTTTVIYKYVGLRTMMTWKNNVVIYNYLLVNYYITMENRQSFLWVNRVFRLGHVRKLWVYQSVWFKSLSPGLIMFHSWQCSKSDDFPAMVDGKCNQHHPTHDVLRAEKCSGWDHVWPVPS